MLLSPENNAKEMFDDDVGGRRIVDGMRVVRSAWGGGDGGTGGKKGLKLKFV